MVAIGGHITSAAIRAGTAAGYIDFRADYDSLTYELIDTPPDVAAGVQRLMSEMDLVYGALDFVVDPQGLWTFLESTPVGNTDGSKMKPARR